MAPGHLGRPMATHKPENQNEEYIEGRNPVLEAMRGPRRVNGILFSSGLQRAGAIREIESLAQLQDVPITVLPADEISAMSCTNSPQGVIASVSPYRYYDLKQAASFLGKEKTAMVIALDGVEDPQNFGSILRLAETTGADFVITAKRRSCSVTPVVAKASAGAVEHVKIVRVPNLTGALTQLKDEGLWVVGADPGGKDRYFDLDLTIPLVFVLGGEGKGMGRLVKEQCDFLAALPLFGEVKSLNVSSTGAVLLYEAVRQRAGKSGVRDA